MDNLPWNVRLFLFLSAPASLWQRLMAFICGVEFNRKKGRGR